jgi:hypothetical protein
VSYTFDWIVPDRILKVVLPFTFDDSAAERLDKDMTVCLDGAMQPIYIIIDWRQAKIHPSIKTFFAWEHVKHAQRGYTITIGMSASPITRYMFGILMRVMESRIKDVSSLEEALAYIQAMDNQASGMS